MKEQKPHSKHTNLKSQVRELTFLHETSRSLTATLDLEDVLKSLIGQVRDYFQADAVSVALLEEETNELIFRVAVGEAADEVIGLSLKPGQGIAGWVVKSGEPTLATNVYKDKRFYSGADEMTGFHTQIILAVPIRVGEKAIGVIEAINPVNGAFDDDDQRILMSVADLAAIAIRNAALYERVQKAERRYESLFSGSADPIIVTDLEGKILELNPQAAATLNCSREQLIGFLLSDLTILHPETYQDALRKVRQGEHADIEMKTPSKSGTRILEAHMAKIDYGGREAIQWIGHDISERVALDRMREDLIHMIIHDLRNPLSIIINSLNVIHLAIVEDDNTLPVDEVLEIALRNSERLEHLIDSLLDLRQLETGQAELEKVKTSTQDFTHEAVEQIRPLAQRKNQQLTLQMAPDLPSLYIDRGMIMRVLTNLLDNAVKFTPMGGKITLSIKKQAQEILFAISDTGPGISPESSKRIFNRFVRFENKNDVKGFGLGLAFCKLAVEAHGGRIWLESKVGQGTTFYFTLPLEVSS